MSAPYAPRHYIRRTDPIPLPERGDLRRRFARRLRRRRVRLPQGDDRQKLFGIPDGERRFQLLLRDQRPGHPAGAVPQRASRQDELGDPGGYPLEPGIHLETARLVPLGVLIAERPVRRRFIGGADHANRRGSESEQVVVGRLVPGGLAPGDARNDLVDDSPHPCERFPVLDGDKTEVLRISRRGRPRGGLRHPQDMFLRDRVLPELPDALAALHRLEDVHGCLPSAIPSSPASSGVPRAPDRAPPPPPPPREFLAARIDPRGKLLQALSGRLLFREQFIDELLACEPGSFGRLPDRLEFAAQPL